jgi:hypothetical protein
MSALCIASIIHGSRLFGTDDSQSDTDVKSVWLPSARDILLGRTDWTVFKSDPTRLKAAHDIDQERHDLYRFLKLVSSGHPVAIEMLFAPEAAHDREPHDAWWEAVTRAGSIVPASVGNFMGFIEEQSAGFGVGGERVQAVSAAMEVLEEAKARDPKASVAEVAEAVVAAAGSPHVKIDEKPDGAYLLIAGRSTPFANKVGVAHRLAWMFLESFDAKTKKLASGDRRNWSTVAHAIRLAEEALELSTTGRITLPRPNAAELLDIRSGRIPADDIATRMEMLIPAVKEAAKSSPLPEAPDIEVIERLVVECYGAQIFAAPESDEGLNLSWR